MGGITTKNQDICAYLLYIIGHAPIYKNINLNAAAMGEGEDRGAWLRLARHF
jgi:hypothetical protein